MLVRSALFGALALISTAAFAQDHWTVQERWVRAHEAFLASDALQGRGSATRDEAIAAAYVASQFEGYGLVHAPGMDSYFQKATIVRLKADGPAQLSVNGKTVDATPTLFTAPGNRVGGTMAVAGSGDPAALPAADVVLIGAADANPMALFRAAAEKKVKLLIVRETEASRDMYARMGGAPHLPAYLEGEAPPARTAVATLPAAAFDALAKKKGATVELTLPAMTEDRAVTTNAIGYLPGSDPKAGTLLFTAHLDHLGVQPDGTIMHGANDDASGTTAVLEIARALAAGEQPKRSILFVCYGSEEIGLYGSKYFGEHPPIPLDQVIANIEFEMIGAQDPKLPKDTLMMTGYDRSNLGEVIKEHGGLVAPDPYPDQHFFQRSDNYSLALKGIVAHTFSGWAVTPTYHDQTDDFAHIDFDFMTKAIQSLIAPMRWLADGDFKPEWKPGGKPEAGE
ncbi:MAG TPA: M28 family peptidase [Sphingomonas sp.]|nr:M28 family peptidase [Sphingomonas sp.]